MVEYVLLPAAYAVPVPSAAVFQPPNVWPVRASVPVLPETAAAAPPDVKLPFAGTDPDVAPFASYAMA